MELKKYLKKQLTDSMQKMEQRIEETKEAIQEIKSLRLQKATYLVTLSSHWASEGEQPTITTVQGSLETAIQRAEQEFKTLNKRTDVQASYHVSVQVGPFTLSVPEEYWKPYASK